MKKIRVPVILGALATATVILVWLLAYHPNKPRQIIAADIPPGTIFQPIDELEDFDISPTLRVLRDPERPANGIAAVKIMVVSNLNTELRNVQAAVWLPEGVLRFTPTGLIGTNLDLWHEDLTPAQPSMGILGSFRFRDFNTKDQILDAFQGPTRVKIIWEAGARYFEFPADHWSVEIIE